MSKISVVMPVYNTKEEFLREAIDSILNQTFVDFEFIIVNDGSTDENVEKVIFSYQDTRIKYLKLPKSCGIAQALNSGLEIAQGEYIARMDADDISLPERFQKQVDFLDTHNDISLCASLIEVFYPNGKRSVTKYIEYPKILEVYRGCVVAHPTVMFRKKDFEKYNLKYDPDSKCEDYDLWSRAILYVNFYVMQEVLLFYRRHDNNYTFTNLFVDEHCEMVRKRLLNHLTGDEKFAAQLEKLVAKKPSFWQLIFSITNGGAKYKVITVLGIKIKIKRKINNKK